MPQPQRNPRPAKATPSTCVLCDRPGSAPVSVREGVAAQWLCLPCSVAVRVGYTALYNVLSKRTLL